jgi:hypothetical protein
LYKNLQPTPSPQQINYNLNQFEGQELTITKQLNAAYREPIPPNDQSQNYVVHCPMANVALPLMACSDLVTDQNVKVSLKHQMQDFENNPQNSASVTTSVETSSQSAPSVNNTYVNATMSIQQLNIQSVNNPHGPGYNPTMSVQQMDDIGMPWA